MIKVEIVVNGETIIKEWTIDEWISKRDAVFGDAPVDEWIGEKVWYIK
jgi:hypothetical protein